MSTYHVGPELFGHFGQTLDKADRSKVHLAVVAEKGARDEVREGRPLIGETGTMLRRHLKKAGLPYSFDDAGNLIFEGVWLTNACHDFDDPGANPTNEMIRLEQRRLYRELDTLPNLKCILALGRASLLSLTNFHRDDILNLRGTKMLSFIGTKMVPTLHPSFYVRGEWRYKDIVQFDINRAVKESYVKDLKLPQRIHNIRPTFSEAMDWLDKLESAKGAVVFEHGPCLSFDLETVLGRYGRPYISCIAFSNHPSVGYCIPFMYRNREPYWSVQQEGHIRRRIQVLLGHSNWTYVGQNHDEFDTRALRFEGFTVPNNRLGFDTMVAHRLVAPGLPHDLGFLVSVYTDEQFYKNESGFHDNLAVPDDRFWQYNSRDATCTLEVAIGIRNDLKTVGLLDWYYREVQSLWPVAHDMWERGFKVDRDALLDVQRTLVEEISQREASVEKELGWVPNVKSYIDMGKVLNKYGIKARRTTMDRPATSEEDLLGYAQRYPEFRPIMRLMLDIRERRTLMSNFLDLTVHSDDFYHACWSIIKTTSMRFACSGADEGIHRRKFDDRGGPQLQNIPESLRHIFVPDRPDWELSTFDLKQAEKLIVVFDAADLYFINGFNAGKDLHQMGGVLIYTDRGYSQDIPPDSLLHTITEVCDDCALKGEKKCVHSKRFGSKVTGHAFDYKMGVNKLITKVLPPAGIFISKKRGEEIRDRIVTPPISAWQDRIAFDLRKHMSLTNACGLRRDFFGIPDDEQVREALSWVASSVVSCIGNRATRRLHDWCNSQRLPARVVHNGHDAATLAHHKGVRDHIYKLAEKAFEWRLIFHGRELLIPIDAKSGDNWAFKKPREPKVLNTMIASGE